jgi:hypothetical protein
VGLRCLRNLAVHVNNKVLLMAEVPLVRAALTAHADVPSVVEAGLSCLHALATHADNKAALMAEVPVACACAGPHVGVDAVALACTQFLVSLARGGAVRSLRAAGVAGIVSAAAAAHPGRIRPVVLGW